MNCIFRWCSVVAVVISLGNQPLLAQKLPVNIIAHRGASFDAPENTISAVKLAWEQGADGTEVDLYLTKDGKIVAIHDKTTKRTAGGIELSVVQTEFAKLRELDYGAWKNPKYQGEKIPTFEEILKVMPRDKKIFIEVKCGPEIVEPLLADLDRAKLPIENTIVICFNASVIKRVKELRPELPALFLHNMKKISVEELIAIAKEIKADGVDLQAGDHITPELNNQLRANGLTLDVWTVNDIEVAKKMVEAGVQGITTDRPAYLREGLAR